VPPVHIIKLTETREITLYLFRTRAVSPPVLHRRVLPERPDDHRATGLFICQVTRRIDFRRR
jgi:hypothetical protein